MHWALVVDTGLGAGKDQREENCSSLHHHVWSDAPAGLTLTTKHFLSLLTPDPSCPRAPDWERWIFWQSRHTKAPGSNCVAPDIVSVHAPDWGPCRRHIHRGPRSCERTASCPLSITQHVFWKGERVEEEWGKLNAWWPSSPPSFLPSSFVSQSLLHFWFDFANSGGESIQCNLLNATAMRRNRAVKWDLILPSAARIR